MPAESPINPKPSRSASPDPSVASQDSEFAAAARRADADLGRSPDAFVSPAERRSAERVERRRQRTVAHEAPIAEREPRITPPRRPGTESKPATTPTRRLTLGDSVSITLVAVIVLGGVLGAILGALSVPGWIIGLLVAGLTVVVLTMVRPHPRST